MAAAAQGRVGEPALVILALYADRGVIVQYPAAGVSLRLGVVHWVFDTAHYFWRKVVKNSLMPARRGARARRPARARCDLRMPVACGRVPSLG